MFGYRSDMREAHPLARLMPWTDRAGRLSWLKLAALAGAALPALVLALQLAGGAAGPKPVTFALHETGTWATRLLLATLAVTPLRRIGDWPRLILVRRLLGLSALAYTLAHLGLYVVDQRFDLAMVTREIVARAYLAIGFVATLGLVALGTTSTDAAIRRMGAGWHRLHRLVHPIAVLAILHGFMQAKADVAPATLMAGLYVTLALYRLAQARGPGLGVASLLGCTLTATVATMAIEYAWYALATGVPAHLVLAANFDVDGEIRPAAQVLLAGLALAGLGAARRRVSRAAGDRPRRATRTGSPA